MQFRKRIYTGIFLAILLFSFLSLLPIPQLKQAYATSSIVQTCYNTADSDTISCTFGTDTTSGDMIVVVATYFGSGVTASITSDTQSLTWTSQIKEASSCTSFNSVQIWTSSSTASHSEEVTVGLSSSEQVTISLYETDLLSDNLLTTSTGNDCTATSAGAVSSLAVGGSQVVIAGYATGISEGDVKFTAGSSYTLVTATCGSTDEFGCSEYTTSLTGTTTAPITFSLSTAFAGAAITFAEGCQSGSQICIAFDPLQSTGAEQLSASNYFTATINNGSSFTFYEETEAMSFTAGQTITLSAQSSGSSSTGEWCWSISSSTCQTVVITAPSSDGSYTESYYYYNLASFVLSYSLAPQSPGTSSNPQFTYQTAPSTSGDTDSPQSINSTIPLASLFSQFWILNQTTPALETSLVSSSGTNGYMYITGELIPEMDHGSTFNNVYPYVLRSTSSSPNSSSFTLTASCTYENAGSQPNNYYQTCGIGSGAVYDAVTGTTLTSCGTFNTCTGSTETTYVGEQIMWYTWGGVNSNGCASNVATSPYYVLVNITNTVDLGNGYCTGYITAGGGASIYFQPEYASIGGVQIYALNFNYASANEVSCSATASTSNVAVDVTCPSPYYSGSEYFVGLSSSSQDGDPDTLVASSPYSQSQFFKVDSVSGEVDDQTYLFAYSSANGISTYNSPAVDMMDGTSCGSDVGCGSAGYQIVFTNQEVYPITFEITGVTGQAQTNAVALNTQLYTVQDLPYVQVVTVGNSITYGFLATIGPYSFYGLIGSGCGQVQKDNTFSPTSSCTIEADYTIPSTQNPQSTLTITINNQIAAIITFIVPSIILLFIFLWLGLAVLNLHGDALVLLLMMAIGVITVAGTYIGHSFLPAWVGGITLVFMFSAFIYNKRGSSTGGEF